MIINNYQEFYRYVQNDQIQIKYSLENCIKVSSKICNCQRAAKARKMEECKNMYETYIKNNLQSAVILFQKKTHDKVIIFNSDNKNLATVQLK